MKILCLLIFLANISLFLLEYRSPASPKEINRPSVKTDNSSILLVTELNQIAPKTKPIPPKATQLTPSMPLDTPIDEPVDIENPAPESNAIDTDNSQIP